MNISRLGQDTARSIGNWVREAAATQPATHPGARMERIGFWLALLLLFVPAFYFLLFFKRYSLLARLGWGVWLGFIVFVRVFGFSDPVLKITPPTAEKGPALVREADEIPLPQYVAKLLGSQYMDRYQVQGSAITLTYESKPEYFDSDDVLADLGISNGYSLMFRRDFGAVNLDVQRQGRPVRLAMTRAGFLRFFNLSDADAQAFDDPRRLKSSPIYNVTPEGKRRFVREFSRPGPAPQPAPPSAPPFVPARVPGAR